MTVKNKKGLIILDGDDTLWKTQELYDYVELEFIKLMESHGFSAEESKIILNEIDVKRVCYRKFSKSRFIESLLITYSLLCGKYGCYWNAGVEETIRNYSDQLFKKPELYKGTEDALHELKKAFYIILYTQGDYEIQKKKINSFSSEFRSLFDEIHIPKIKNAQNLKQILKESDVPLNRIWIIGNSIRSDINPALQIGINVIWIPRGIWSYEDKPAISSNYIECHSLIEAVNEILNNNEQRS